MNMNDLIQFDCISLDSYTADMNRIQLNMATMLHVVTTSTTRAAVVYCTVKVLVWYLKDFIASIYFIPLIISLALSHHGAVS